MTQALSNYLIKEEKLALLQDPDKLRELMDGGQHLQEIVGFSDDILLDFYESASKLFDTERFEDCLNAFVFLTTMNPFVPEFWVSMGLCQDKLEMAEEAIQSYFMAAATGGDNIRHYFRATQACLESTHPQRARELVNMAKQVLSEAHESLRPEFKDEVDELEAFVSENL